MADRLQHGGPAAETTSGDDDHGGGPPARASAVAEHGLSSARGRYAGCTSGSSAFSDRDSSGSTHTPLRRGEEETRAGYGSLVPVQAQPESLVLSSVRLQVLCYVLAELSSASTLLLDYTRAMLNLPHRLLACWQGVMAAAASWQRCDLKLRHAAALTARRRYRRATMPSQGERMGRNASRHGSREGHRGLHEAKRPPAHRRRRERKSRRTEEEGTTAHGPSGLPTQSSATSPAAGYAPPLSARAAARATTRQTGLLSPTSRHPDLAQTPRRRLRDVRVPRDVRYALADYVDLEDAAARGIEAARQRVVSALFQQYLQVIVVESRNDLVLYWWLQPRSWRAQERAEQAVMAAAVALAYGELRRSATEKEGSVPSTGRELSQARSAREDAKEYTSSTPEAEAAYGRSWHPRSQNASLCTFQEHVGSGCYVPSPRTPSGALREEQQQPGSLPTPGKHLLYSPSSKELFQNLKEQGKETGHRFVELSDADEEGEGDDHEGERASHATGTAAPATPCARPPRGRIKVLSRRQPSDRARDANNMTTPLAAAAEKPPTPSPVQRQACCVGAAAAPTSSDASASQRHADPPRSRASVGAASSREEKKGVLAGSRQEYGIDPNTDSGEATLAVPESGEDDAVNQRDDTPTFPRGHLPRRSPVTAAAPERHGGRPQHAPGSHEGGSRFGAVPSQPFPIPLRFFMLSASTLDPSACALSLMCRCVILAKNVRNRDEEEEDDVGVDGEGARHASSHRDTEAGSDLGGCQGMRREEKYQRFRSLQEEEKELPAAVPPQVRGSTNNASGCGEGPRIDAKSPHSTGAGGEDGREGYFYVVIARRAVGGCQHARPCFGNRKFIFAPCDDDPDVMVRSFEDVDGESEGSDVSGESSGGGGGEGAELPRRRTALRQRHRYSGGTEEEEEKEEEETGTHSQPSHPLPDFPPTSRSPSSSRAFSREQERSASHHSRARRLGKRGAAAARPLASFPAEMGEDWRQRMLSFGQELSAAAASPLVGTTFPPPHFLPPNDNVGASTPTPTPTLPPPLLPSGSSSCRDGESGSRFAVSHGEYEECGEDGLMQTRRRGRYPKHHHHYHHHDFSSPGKSANRAAEIAPARYGAAERRREEDHVARLRNDSPTEEPVLGDGDEAKSDEVDRVVNADAHTAPAAGRSNEESARRSFSAPPLSSDRTTPTPTCGSGGSGSDGNEGAEEDKSSSDMDEEPDADGFVVMHCDYCSISYPNGSTTGEKGDGENSFEAASTDPHLARDGYLLMNESFHEDADSASWKAGDGALVKVKTSPLGGQQDVSPFPAQGGAGLPGWDAVGLRGAGGGRSADAATLTTFEQTVLMPPGAGQSFVAIPTNSTSRRATTAPAAGGEASTASDAATDALLPTDGDLAFAQELFSRLEFWCRRGQDRSSFVDPSHRCRPAPPPSREEDAAPQESRPAAASREEGGEAEVGSGHPTTQQTQGHAQTLHEDEAREELKGWQGRMEREGETSQAVPGTFGSLRVPLKLLISDVGHISFTVQGSGDRGGGNDRRHHARTEEADSDDTGSWTSAEVGNEGMSLVVVEPSKHQTTVVRSGGVAAGISPATFSAMPAAFNAKGQALLREALLQSTEAVVVAAREGRAHRHHHDRVHLGGTTYVPQGTLSDDDDNPWSFDQHEHLGVVAEVDWLQGQQPESPPPSPPAATAEKMDSHRNVYLVPPDGPAVAEEERAAKKPSSLPRPRQLSERERHQRRVERLRSEFRLARSARLDVLLVDRARQKPIAALTLLPRYARTPAASRGEGAPHGHDPQKVVETTTYAVGAFTHYITPLWRYLREEKAVMVDMDRTLVDNAITFPLFLVRRRLSAWAERRQSTTSSSNGGGGGRPGGETMFSAGHKDNHSSRGTGEDAPGEGDAYLRAFLELPFSPVSSAEAFHYEFCRPITYSHEGGSASTHNSSGEKAMTDEEQCTEMLFVRPGMRQLLHRLAVQWGIPVILVTKSTKRRTNAVLDGGLDPKGVLFLVRERQVVTADDMAAALIGKEGRAGQPQQPHQHGRRKDMTKEKSAAAVLTRYDSLASHAVLPAPGGHGLAHPRQSLLTQARGGKARGVVILDDSPQVWREADWPATVAVAPYTLGRVDPAEYLSDNGYLSSLALSCLYGTRCLVCPSTAWPSSSKHKPRPPLRGGDTGEGSGRAEPAFPHCVCRCSSVLPGRRLHAAQQQQQQQQDEPANAVCPTTEQGEEMHHRRGKEDRREPSYSSPSPSPSPSPPSASSISTTTSSSSGSDVDHTFGSTSDGRALLPRTADHRGRLRATAPPTPNSFIISDAHLPAAASESAVVRASALQAPNPDVITGGVVVEDGDGESIDEEVWQEARGAGSTGEREGCMTNEEGRFPPPDTCEQWRRVSENEEGSQLSSSSGSARDALGDTIEDVIPLPPPVTLPPSVTQEVPQGSGGPADQATRADVAGAPPSPQSCAMVTTTTATTSRRVPSSVEVEDVVPLPR